MPALLFAASVPLLIAQKHLISASAGAQQSSLMGTVFLFLYQSTGASLDVVALAILFKLGLVSEGMGSRKWKWDVEST